MEYTMQNKKSSASFSIPTAVGLQNKKIHSNLNKIRHKIFVMSGKGGVGKSSVTVNIAIGLAEKGYSVGILDIDFHGPSVPKLLNLSEEVTADAHGCMYPVRYSESVCVISMDSFLENKDTAIAWKGPKKIGAIRQFLEEVHWGELDYLIIDSPPGTGDEHMAILGLIPDAQCLVVTTPQEISLADVRKALSFLQQIKMRILGLVENMSGLSCPGCGHEIEIFKKGGGKELAVSQGIPFLGSIPLDPMAVIAGDQGMPVVTIKADSKAKDSFLQLTDQICTML